MKAVDKNGNPILYEATGYGYDKYITGNDQIKLDSNKDSLIVYDSSGNFKAVLNLDGTKNDYLTNLHKEIGTVTLPPLINPIPKPNEFGPNHTGGNQIPEPMPGLEGYPIPKPEDLPPIHTGHDGGLSDVEIKHDTGGEQIIERDWRDYVLTADNKITQSEHAEIRGKEGRPVGQIINDIENAKPSDIIVQDDGRWVILGSKGRVHILEPDGEHVTSMVNDRKNTINRIKDGRWERPSNEKLQEFYDKFSDYIKR